MVRGTRSSAATAITNPPLPSEPDLSSPASGKRKQEPVPSPSSTSNPSPLKRTRTHADPSLSLSPTATATARSDLLRMDGKSEKKPSIPKGSKGFRSKEDVHKNPSGLEHGDERETFFSFEEDAEEQGESDLVNEVTHGTVLPKKRRREILGVLIAMETPHPSDHSRQKHLKLVDTSFPRPPPEQPEELKGSDGKDDSAENGEGSTIITTTLRKVMMGEEELSVGRLMLNLQSLSKTLTPNLPNPFTHLLPSPSPSLPLKPHPPIPFSQPPTLSTRLTGSKYKQDKDLPTHDHLLVLKQVILTLLLPPSPRGSAREPSLVLDPPRAMTHWALHQRTTVPWPLPRPVQRGERGAQSAPTERVHLDWFTSKVGSGVGRWVDVGAELGKEGEGMELDKGEGKEEGEEEGEGDGEGEGEEIDIGSLSRLQAEGYFGQGDIVTLAPPDRSDEDLARSRAPKLGETLFASASKKARRYREKRKGDISTGRAVNYLRHYSSFTPSFAPTYDSTMATRGWTFDTSFEAARVSALNRAWIGAGWNSDYEREIGSGSIASGSTPIQSDPHDQAVKTAKLLVGDEIEESAIDPSLLSAIVDQQEEHRSVQTRLADNARWMTELAEMQEERLRRGEREIKDPQEHVIATKVLANLNELAGQTMPRSLISTDRGTASRLAQTLVTVPNAVYRGSLDPARPKAMAENYTSTTRTEPRPPKRRDHPLPPIPTPSKPQPGLTRPPSYGTPGPRPGHPSMQNQWTQGISTPGPGRPPSAISTYQTPTRQDLGPRNQLH